MQPKTLDHVAFWVADRDAIAAMLTSRLGVHEIDRQDKFTLLGADARRFKLTLFDAEGPREAGPFVHVALRVNRLPAGAPAAFSAGEDLRIVLVDSADDAVADADELGIEVESTVDAANTYAAFLVGPEGVRIEYVEHKASFSLT